MNRTAIPRTEKEIRELIDSYSKSGINLILPEVIYNGYSAYPSAYLKQQDLWNGLDMLKIVIDEAHKQGMEVHPWVWVFRTGNAGDHGGILKVHPDWVALDRNCNALSANRGYWLCPSLSEVRSLLKCAYRELTGKYDIDGIHLDYVRYEVESPEPYCYNESCRQKFKAQCGIDPINIEPFTRSFLNWHMWREQQVDSFVREVSEDLRKIRPNLKISAAVGSTPNESRISLLQDWGHWADNKWVDFLCPMDYTSNNEYFRKTVDLAYDRVKDHALLAPGLGLQICREIAPFIEQIGITRTKPVEGSTLFASEYLDQPRLTALAEGVFSKKAVLPFRDPEKAISQLIESAHARRAEGNSADNLGISNSELALGIQLMNNWVYRSANTGFIPPSPPPLFIPEKVEPLPTVCVPQLDAAPKLDGALSDQAWSKASVIHIVETSMGKKALYPTDVMIGYNGGNLYLGFKCVGVCQTKKNCSVTLRDGAVFADNSVELFLSPTGREYYHLGLNSCNVQFDAKGYDAAWNGKWNSATASGNDFWTAEFEIPFSVLGVASPVDGSWKANFCRNQLLDNGVENSCWSPTYGSYHTPVRFGSMRFNSPSSQR